MQLVPAVDRFDRAVLAAVLVIGANVMPPRLDRSREPFEHPQPGLRLGFAGLAEGWAARLVHGDALGNQLVPTEQPVDQAARFGVLLETGRFRACLVIQQNDLCAPADLLVVSETPALPTDGAAIHTNPEAIWPAGCPGHAVVQVP